MCVVLLIQLDTRTFPKSKGGTCNPCRPIPVAHPSGYGDWFRNGFTTQTKSIRVLSWEVTRGRGKKENGQDVVLGLSICKQLSFKPSHTQKTHFLMEKWGHYTREASSPGSPRASAPSKGARGKLECLPSLASKFTEHPCHHNLFITSLPQSLAIFRDRGLDSIF